MDVITRETARLDATLMYSVMIKLCSTNYHRGDPPRFYPKVDATLQMQSVIIKCSFTIVPSVSWCKNTNDTPNTKTKTVQFTSQKAAQVTKDHRQTPPAQT
jgi:hypothetical protein